MRVSNEFAEALITYWGDDSISIGKVLYELEGFSGISVGNEDWVKAAVKHGLNPKSNLKQSVRVYVANHFTKANNALWDGKVELALKWVVSGKDNPPGFCRMRQAKEEFRKASGYKVIRARDLDKRHDWNTCK